MTSQQRPGNHAPDDARNAAGDAHRLDRLDRRVAGALLALFVVVVTLIVFWPGPPAPVGQSTLKDYLSEGKRHGLPSWITFAYIENLANVLMFVPLGLLASLALRRRNFLAVPAAAAASGLIELVQLLLLPSRVASTQDIRVNTIGALLGFLLSLPALRRRRRRRRRFRLGRLGAGESRRRAALAARA